MYKILLVEDDKFIARAYKDGLQKAGFVVEQAFDGDETLEKVKSGKFDLVLLDLIMPVKDGFETLSSFRMDEDLKTMPVIILSNLGQDSDIERARSLGASDYLIKSNFSMKEVVAKIQEFLVKNKK